MGVLAPGPHALASGRSTSAAGAAQEAAVLAALQLLHTALDLDESAPGGTHLKNHRHAASMVRCLQHSEPASGNLRVLAPCAWPASRCRMCCWPVSSASEACKCMMAQLHTPLHHVALRPESGIRHFSVLVHCQLGAACTAHPYKSKPHRNNKRLEHKGVRGLTQCARMHSSFQAYRTCPDPGCAILGLELTTCHQPQPRAAFAQAPNQNVDWRDACHACSGLELQMIFKPLMLPETKRVRSGLELQMTMVLQACWWC